MGGGRREKGGEEEEEVEQGRLRSIEELQCREGCQGKFQFVDTRRRQDTPGGTTMCQKAPGGAGRR